MSVKIYPSGSSDHDPVVTQIRLRMKQIRKRKSENITIVIPDAKANITFSCDHQSIDEY